MGMALNGIALSWSDFYQEDRGYPKTGVDLLEFFPFFPTVKRTISFLNTSFGIFHAGSINKLPLVWSIEIWYERIHFVEDVGSDLLY
jgi:hypothetical protein